MELRHLRYFAAVAQTRHFGRAAEGLHMAQPALSQSIRALEKELGTRLFTRTTRQVALTPAGEFFAEETRRVLEAIENSVRGVRRIAEGQLGLVRIGFTGTAAFTHLPRIARILKHDLPGVAVEVHADLLTPAQTSMLAEGSLDLGLLRPADPSSTMSEHLNLRTVEVEPLALAVPDDHRLATEHRITMADLSAEEFVLYADKASAVNDAVLRSCQAAGFVPFKAHQAPGTAALLALVAAGLGIALVPASARAIPLAGVVFRDVPETATVELACAWRNDTALPLVQRVIESLDAAGLFVEHTELTEVSS